MSYTIDYVNKIISYGKIDAQLDDVDLDADIDQQIENAPIALEKASVKVAGLLKTKVDKVFNRQPKPEVKSD